jgi:hypothetical protein
MAAPSGEMVTAESWLGLLVVEVAGVVGAALFVDSDPGSDAAFPLTAVCVSVGDDAALLICMAIFPHSYIQSGRAAHHRERVTEPQPQPQSGPYDDPQSYDAVSPALSALQKPIFRVGKGR